MPSTIPYDPSLVLGNIVHPLRLERLKAIAKLQAPVDAKQQELNSLIALKRSTDMTIQEMIDMKLDPKPLIAECEEVGGNIQKTAFEYGKMKIESEKLIQPIRGTVSDVNYDIESPIDYNQSKLQYFGLANDSMQLNVQYFSRINNGQVSSTHATNVSSFVSDSLKYFGSHYAQQMSASVQSQVNTQIDDHDIAGTLVMSISCTHRNAQIFAPFILDVDKAVRAWNYVYADDMIKTNSALSALSAEALSETIAERNLYLLSGATFGSSFVGMVHILNSTKTVTAQQMSSLANNLENTFKVGGWFASASGGFGVESSFSNSAKSLLSTQNIQSHCSLVSMGIIPSIKSNQVKLGVKQLIDLDPAKEMEKLAALQGATATENNTISSAADAARTGAQMISLQNATITATLSGLAEIDDGQNSIIDINSMMSGMEDYINKCVGADENVGVPINYYLKPITKPMIIRSWLAKYYPNDFNIAGKADDSEDKNK